MAISTDGGYSYHLKSGNFAAAFARMGTFAIDRVTNVYNGSSTMKIGFPSIYTFSNDVYAAPLKYGLNGAYGYICGTLSTGANILSVGSVNLNTSAYKSPFMICVTYQKFKDIGADPAVWREVGVNPDTASDKLWDHTNRLISKANMGDYICITGVYVFDNSHDGDYSSTNKRTLLDGYDVFTKVNMPELKMAYSNSWGVMKQQYSGDIALPLRLLLTPLTTDTTGNTAPWNMCAALMNHLGTPISGAIQIHGFNAKNSRTHRATLYPSLTSLQKDLNAWGMPYTTDLDAAYNTNVSDLPDYVPDGVPDNPSGGGDGTGDNFSDPIDFPAAPFSPASLGGYLTLVQSPTELKGLTDVLWKPVIKDLSDALKVYFNTDNLTNSVLSIMFYPVDLAAMSLGLTHSNNIRIAWSTDNISADIMANHVPHEIDAGSYQMTEYYGSFLDYAPYTTADIWLPYIGYKPLDIDAVMDKTINVKYYVDFIDGLATAVILADGQPINTYTGQLGIDLAVTGRDNAAKLRQTVDAVMTAATGVNKSVSGIMQGAAQAAVGNVGGTLGAVSGVGGNIAGGVAALAQTALQQPSTVIYGTAGGENWLSMPQKCHIKFTRTVAASPASYINEMGYPTTYTSLVSKFTGYLHCAAVFGDFTGIPAEDADEIQGLLQGGVHISKGAFE